MTEQTKAKGLAFNKGGYIALFLTVVFVVLRVSNAITWDWVWVVSPIWIYAGLIILGYVLFVVTLIIVFLAVRLSKKDKKDE